MKRKSLLLSLPAVGIFLLVTGFLILRIVQINGMFVYGLDDAYIHLSLAKTWAESGVLGVNPGEYASASSSPLYTAVLALSHLLLGQSVTRWMPLALNLLAGIIFLVWLSHRLQESDRSSRATVIWLVGSVFVAMLSPLALFGMEHLIHGCAFVIALDLFAGLIAGKIPVKGYGMRLAVVAVVLGGIRFEGLLMMGILLGLAWLRDRDWRYVATGILALLPIGLVIIYNWVETGFLLPNSVFIKLHPPAGPMAELSGVKRLFAILGMNLRLSTTILPGLILSAALFLARQKTSSPSLRSRGQVYLLLLMLACLIHAASATGVLLRYEAYLVFGMAGGVALFGKQALDHFLALRNDPTERWIGAGLLMVITGLMFQNFAYYNVYEPIRKAAKASTEIHDQQMMMTEFVREYYPQGVVAINDLGCVSYLTDARIVDLVGLGHTGIANLYREDNYTWSALREVMAREKVEFAMIYLDWFDEVGYTPELRVATWNIDSPYILGGGTVSFLAFDPARVAVLQQQLRAFESRLPDRVRAVYDPLP